MDQSFPLRREEIVKKESAVQNTVERWPALFTERQVFAEFNRIASKNLEGDFFEALDQYAPRFIELFKTKKGTVGHKLIELMQHMSWMTPGVTVPALLSSKAFPFYSVTTPVNSTRPGATFFTNLELEILMCSYGEFQHVFRKKCNTPAAAKERETAWENIAARVNACNPTGEKRTWQQLKIKYKNIVQTANRKKADARKTGGGPAPPPLTEAEELALSQYIGRPVAEGIPGGSSSSEMCVSLWDTARDEALECITVGVLTVVSEDSPHEGQSSVDLSPISTAIILEGGIVMDHKNLPQAVCLLFGLTYALHLDYPKCMANTLIFIQTVMLGLGKKNLPPKLLTLKNSLLG
ncbi:hypothetical protein N1851_009452 [Merluccius polli]|uniref:Myb/SANT-like DNA-binding domain-containing protein n=1 Tax=Merluccius polli TaxID=89951 RepID=A0AA47P7Z4_MERPO|nr:hypothetical protein N1851_009452 [Merluccius polli]